MRGCKLTTVLTHGYVDLSERTGHRPLERLLAHRRPHRHAARSLWPLVQRGRVPYADLAEVERNTGREFTPEQIAMAVDGRPPRLVTIEWRNEWQRKRPTILAEAQTELVDTNVKLSDTDRRRDQLLLAGDERGLDAIEGELASLQKAAVRQADRIPMLEEQARQEEAAAVVKRRGDVVVRFEKKLQRPTRKPTNCRPSRDRPKRSSGRSSHCEPDASAAWPIGDLHANAVAGTAEGAALSGAAVKRLLSWHLYRIGARPFRGGTARRNYRGEFSRRRLPKK